VVKNELTIISFMRGNRNLRLIELSLLLNGTLQLIRPFRALAREFATPPYIIKGILVL
jgi:hypothetical protein